MFCKAPQGDCYGELMAETIERNGLMCLAPASACLEEADTIWHRWYHAPGRRGILVRPDQHRGKSTGLLTTVNDRDKRFGEVSYEGSQAQKAFMKEYFEGSGWESERIFEGTDVTDDCYYDIIAQVHMQKWSKGRVALLGDAGYCASPFSGIGTTLALNRAYELAGALATHALDYDTAFALMQYSYAPDRGEGLEAGAGNATHSSPLRLRGVSGSRMGSGQIGYLLNFVVLKIATI